jgi:hypothetical protein
VAKTIASAHIPNERWAFRINCLPCVICDGDAPYPGQTVSWRSGAAMTVRADRSCGSRPFIGVRTARRSPEPLRRGKRPTTEPPFRGTPMRRSPVVTSVVMPLAAGLLLGGLPAREGRHDRWTLRGSAELRKQRAYLRRGSEAGLIF